MYHTANSSFRVRTFPSYVNIMDIAGIRTVVFDITVRIPGTMDTEILDETEVDNDKTKRGSGAKCSK